MSDKSTERVLGLPTAASTTANYSRGSVPLIQNCLGSARPVHLEYRREAKPETTRRSTIDPICDPAHRGELFHYTRGGGGTETRLRARRSVVSAAIFAATTPIRRPVSGRMLREVA